MSQNPGRPDDLTPGRPSDDIDLSEQGGVYVAGDRDGGDLNDAEWEEEDERPRGPLQTILAGLRELVIVIVLAMALSFVVKTWLFQAFYIPSGSMEDTLVRDDRVIVSKLTPGPFDLRRGDVIVFEDPGVPTPWLSGSTTGARSTLGGPFHDALVYVGLLPEDADNHLIKRVIGLPGDHVQADGSTGKIKVNGVAITEPYIKPGDAPSEGKAFDIVVPAGRVWVMGDHRSDSADSRYHDDGTGRTGSVPIDKIVGRALFVVWPIEHVTWLGVPARTFEQVPAPAKTPSVSPSSIPTVPTTHTTAATKAAAG
ncbi:signal peptidase I [Intrasporangium oryzae NRRL B-24470]|uniref:Signal peptidase I n=1 Tax=Intrasporangium oryzae NRRL B-24470 TaxID=1386089 RepID=W9G9N3_9MICO|nr:signal peptidase I [Intrasporangium oryzae]EWT01513.1 signal peptidase I [Intrasporangium oryzae NRRL B-24470]